MNETEHAEQHNEGLLLSGIDGANPLAFLAALGTLRGLTIAWPERDVKLWWDPRDAWRPRLSIDAAPPTREDALAIALRTAIAVSGLASSALPAHHGVLFAKCLIR